MFLYLNNVMQCTNTQDPRFNYLPIVTLYYDGLIINLEEDKWFLLLGCLDETLIGCSTTNL